MIQKKYNMYINMERERENNRTNGQDVDNRYIWVKDI